jgi:hypothetical protein
MRPSGWIAVLLFLLAAIPGARAQTASFEEAATLLLDSCGKDIEEYCYGVNLGGGALKNCLSRNHDSVSPTCRTDNLRVFTMIQKRAQARRAVLKACEPEIRKSCAEVHGEAGPSLECLLAAPPRGMGWRCAQALTAAGMR